jgi:hypothetical protein
VRAPAQIHSHALPRVPARAFARGRGVAAAACSPGRVSSCNAEMPCKVGAPRLASECGCARNSRGRWCCCYALHRTIAHRRDAWTTNPIVDQATRDSKAEVAPPTFTMRPATAQESDGAVFQTHVIVPRSVAQRLVGTRAACLAGASTSPEQNAEGPTVLLIAPQTS